MSVDLLDSLNGVFGGPVLRQVSALFGEPEAKTGAALKGSNSSLLAALVLKSQSSGGATELLRRVSGEDVDPQLSSRIASAIDRGNLDPALATGESMASSIFGNRTGGVTQAIADVAGIKASSAGGLLAIAAPTLMSLLKRQVSQGTLDERGLGALLLNQRGSLLKSGLDSRITNAMGFGSLQSMLGSAAGEGRARDADVTAELHTGTEQPRRPIPVQASRRNWIPWAIGAAVVAAVAFALLNARMGRNDSSPATVATLPAVVFFDTGQAVVDADDRRTIIAVVAAARNSDTPLIVTGYTDRSGDPQQNLALARNRAAAVRDALVAQGIPATRVVLVPPATATEAGAADDARRVEISLASADTEIRR